MAIRLRIDASRYLIRTHRFQILGGWHPIISRQIQITVGYLMHILSHLRERSLQRYRMAPLVFQGEARVDIEEVLIANMKQS